MELIPIIQLAAIVFATVVFFVIMFSYIVYKAKVRKQTPPSYNGKEKNYNNQAIAPGIYQKTYFGNYAYAQANKEHTYVIPKSNTKQLAPARLTYQSKMSERFNIVNDQCFQYPIYENRGNSYGTFFRPQYDVTHSSSRDVASTSKLDNYSIQGKYSRVL